MGPETVATLFALHGSNCVSDVFFVRVGIFFSNVVEKYIRWNVPYWIRDDREVIGALNLHKVEPWYLYRVYEGNYVHSDAGKFEASNGCLRSVLEIANYYDVIGFPISRTLAFLSMKLFNRPIVVYKTRPYSQLYDRLARSVLRCYYRDDELKTDPYLSSVLTFYSHHPSNREIYLTQRVLDACGTWYTGKDARLFHAAMHKGALDPLYDCLLREARLGFGNVAVLDEQYLEPIRAVLKFLNLRATVSIAE